MADTAKKRNKKGSLNLAQPLVVLIKKLELSHRVDFDDPAETVPELVNDIAEMDAPNRPRESLLLVEDYLQETVDFDPFTESAPITVESLEKLLRPNFEAWIDRTARRALELEDRAATNGQLVLLGAFDIMAETFEIASTIAGPIEASEEEEELFANCDTDEYYTIGSIIAGLYARLYAELRREGTTGDVDFGAIARDVVHADKALIETIRPDADYPVSVEAMEEADYLRTAMYKGVVRAYLELNCTVEEGAALANMDVDEFENLLENEGVEP